MEILEQLEELDNRILALREVGNDKQADALEEKMNQLEKASRGVCVECED